MKKIYLPVLFSLFISLVSFANSALIVTVTVMDPTCDGAHNGSVTITASGGVAPYLYSIDGIGWQASNSFSGLDGGGSYTAYARDVMAQDAFVDFTTNLGPTLTGNVTVTPAACFGGWNGVITIIPTNVTAPYTFTLVGEGVSSSDPIVTFGGRYAAPYQIDITDALGCFGTLYATVNDGDSIRSHTTITPRSCAGSWDGYIILNFDNGAAPYMVSSPTIGTAYINAPNQGIGIPTTGYQTIDIQDVDGCIGQMILDMPDGLPAITTAGNDAAICTGGSIQLSGTGPATLQYPNYQWSPATGLDNSNIANPVATPAVTTTYTLTTETNSSSGAYCISSATVTISPVDVEIPFIEYNTPVLSVTDPQGSVTYTWQQLNSSSWEDVSSGSSYNISSDGEYRVKAVNGLCEQYSTAVTTGAASKNPFAIAMYPNPATNVLVLNDLKTTDGWQKLEIINYQGQRSIPVKDIRNQTKVSVTIAVLSSGIYIARLTKGDGRTVELRFIKQ